MLPAGGAALGWLLLTTLWLPRWITRAATRAGAQRRHGRWTHPAASSARPDARADRRASLHGRLDLQPAAQRRDLPLAGGRAGAALRCARRGHLEAVAPGGDAPPARPTRATTCCLYQRIAPKPVAATRIIAAMPAPCWRPAGRHGLRRHRHHRRRPLFGEALAALSVGSAVFISVFVALMGVMQALLPIWAELHGASAARVGRSVRQALYLAALRRASAWRSAVPGPLLHWTEVPAALQGEVSATSRCWRWRCRPRCCSACTARSTRAWASRSW